MKKAVLLAIVVLVVSLTPALAAPVGAPPKPAAKNVIVMISDGWGFNHLTATSYYEYGKDARQVYNRLPFQVAMTTYSTDGYSFGYDPALAWGSFDWVKAEYTDSASAATAMACGVKTYDAAIGVDPDKKPVPNALELAESKGKATGVITSVEWTHATPAAARGAQRAPQQLRSDRPGNRQHQCRRRSDGCRASLV